MSRDNIMRLQINQIGVPMFLTSLFSLLEFGQNRMKTPSCGSV